MAYEIVGDVRSSKAPNAEKKTLLVAFMLTEIHENALSGMEHGESLGRVLSRANKDLSHWGLGACLYFSGRHLILEDTDI